MRGFEDWTEEDVKRHNAKIHKDMAKNQFIIQDNKILIAKKKSKYGAKKIEIDGIKFDSQKERRLLLRTQVEISSKRYQRFLQTARVRAC